MRVFVAIKLSEELKSNIARFRQQYAALPVRWNRPEGLHVTMISPWEVGGSEMPGLIEHLNMLDAGRFDLFFDRLKMPVADIIKSNREGDMVWLYGPVSKPFLALKDALERILGFKFTRTRLQNHVTLARFERKHLSASKVKRIDEPVKWHQRVDSVVLFRSHASPDGATYETLAEFPLK